MLDIALQPLKKSNKLIINVWAVATNGDVLRRRGVSIEMPNGTAWEHISLDEPLIAITGSDLNNGIWAISKTGSAWRRDNVSYDNPEGTSWKRVHPPKGCVLKQISAGELGVWAIDNTGQMVVRDVSTKNPEGTKWHVLPNFINDPPHEDGKMGFRSVSVGTNVWAVSNSGFLCKRCGVTCKNPAGTGWILGLKANFDYVSGI